MIVYKVLNPAVRLSWIQKHWEREYINSAEATIRQTVSLPTCSARVYSSNTLLQDDRIPRAGG